MRRQDEAKERIGPTVPKPLTAAPPVTAPPRVPLPSTGPLPTPPPSFQPLPTAPRPVIPPLPPQGIAFGLAPAAPIMMQPLGGIQPPPAILGEYTVKWLFMY
jgi:hypothetical protein